MNAITWAAGLLPLLLIADAAGFHFGRTRAGALDEDSRTVILAITSGILGIVALLLGFSFSMAASRFDSRRFVIIDEANAIGTAYLRAGLLPEPDRSELRRELHRYVDARVAFYAAGNDPARRRDAEAQSDASQMRAWRLAAAAASRDPRSITIGLLIQSLNEMIDLQSKRAALFRSRVPTIIPLLLAIVSVVAVAGVGCCSGLCLRRNAGFTSMLAIAIVAVFFVILDLDEPQSGVIRVRQQAMMDLRNRIAEVSE